MEEDEYWDKIGIVRSEVERVDRVLKSVSVSLAYERHHFAHATLEQMIQHLRLTQQMVAELAGIKETVIL